MKILSAPEGGGLLTNAEVSAWLREKNLDIHKRDLPPTAIRPPRSTAMLAKDIQDYLSISPSCNETVESVRTLFQRLQKYNLAAPERLMIANIRPENYAQLTALLADVYSRYDDDQLYEMLEIINKTLESRKKPEQQTNDKEATADAQTPEKPGASDTATAPGPTRDATVMDITMTRGVTTAHAAGTRERTAAEETSALLDGTAKPAAAPSMRDATVMDITAPTTTAVLHPPVVNPKENLAAASLLPDADEGRDATVVDISRPKPKPVPKTIAAAPKTAQAPPSATKGVLAKAAAAAPPTEASRAAPPGNVKTEMAVSSAEGKGQPQGSRAAQPVKVKKEIPVTSGTEQEQPPPHQP